jgi:WD40 repeat protein
VAPSLAGVEMIARVVPNVFASSNDGGSIVIWQTDGSFSEDGIQILKTLTYGPEAGAANDGAVTEWEGVTYFVSGHASGFVLIWQVHDLNRFELIAEVDLRSADPIPSPYGLKNIRGVETWRPGYMITGSEDGDLCLLKIPEGRVVARCRYNATAQRGINDIDVCGDYLVVANCSVGADDKNLWLFRVADSGFTLLDAQNLRVNPALDQVFNFCVDQGVVDGTQYFFSATQEGVVWIGTVEESGLRPLGTQKVSTSFGAALSYAPASRLLAVAGDNLHLFEVQWN